MLKIFFRYLCHIHLGNYLIFNIKDEIVLIFEYVSISYNSKFFFFFVETISITLFIIRSFYS